MGMKKVHGVNIAVENLEEARKNYELLLNSNSKYLDEKEFGYPHLEGYRFDLNGFIINVISSKKEGTSISNYLKKFGEGLFLISFEIESHDETYNSLKKKKPDTKFLLEQPVETEEYIANFIHPKSFNGVQIELLSYKNK